MNGSFFAVFIVVVVLALQAVQAPILQVESALPLGPTPPAE